MQKSFEATFKNFMLSDTEGLDKAYDRFQKLISLLEVHGAVFLIEDAIEIFSALPSSFETMSQALISCEEPKMDVVVWDIDESIPIIMVFDEAVQSLDDEDLEQIDNDDLEAPARASRGPTYCSCSQKSMKFVYEEMIASLEFGHQISSKDKTSLGYGDQLNENDSSGSKGYGYHAVPPPLIGNYMPPLVDLSFIGLDDSVYRPTTNKTSASMSQVETTPNIRISNEKVNTVRVNGVNTAKHTAVSAIREMGSLLHMTGNKDFLIDYQDIDGGFVAFGGSARGASTPMETNKALTKDKDGEDVDIHLYRQGFFVDNESAICCYVRNQVLVFDWQALEALISEGNGLRLIEAFFEEKLYGTMCINAMDYTTWILRIECKSCHVMKMD
ncbi:hypothetical protein Tco_0287268 [Tanacetum coccineum]